MKIAVSSTGPTLEDPVELKSNGQTEHIYDNRYRLPPKCVRMFRNFKTMGLETFLS